ncbi:MAG: ATP-binding protein [Parachlamydiaceae bacterium]|nr:ATP-binding protein [Parachlamydiaceae bacterium]
MHAWEKFVAAQELELGSETVQKWLKTLKILRYDACNLYLEAQDAFQAIWFEEHIRQSVQMKLLNNNNKRIKVHLSTANVEVKGKNSRPKKEKPVEAVRPVFNLHFDDIDPYCNFSNFVVSESNQLTYRIFSQTAGFDTEKKGNFPIPPELGTFNPIYLHGNSGVGKTHLLMATVHLLRQKGVKVLFARAQTFTDHVVSAIRAGEMSLFRQAYRNSDVLIIDDIHVFSRKGATQEEFFHTFNTLHVAGKQIILSANCAPGDLQYIEPRLVSRFEWGIVLSLEASSREEISEILQQKAAAMQYPIHSKVIDFLLDSFSSCKSLNRALEALILRSHLNGNINKLPNAQLTVPLARQILSDLIQEELQAALTPTRIVQGVAEHFGIKPEDVLGKAQTRDCVLPRQISMHLCRHQLKMPFVKIGDLFEKDHSTVMSSVKLIQKGIETDDKEIASAYRIIYKKIKV